MRALELRQIRRPAHRFMAISDPPNTALIEAVAHALDILLLQITRDGRVVLDDLAVHVHDIERAVRADGEIDRPEPLIAGGQKLLVCFGTDRGETSAFGLKNAAMD